jgi:ubiquinone/menaquinone biosynthesis C-methylase UbiE
VDADARRARATSFDAVAAEYARSRPGYPAAAVEWLTGSKPADVVDLGAGTGKLTAALVALGHRVVAVEPLAEMRARLELTVSGVRALAGTAEAMPLPEASADVVTVAQAFHWFDHAAALREIARVLRPGGRIALVWNVRDETESWVHEMNEVMVGRTGIDRGAGEPIAASGLFGPVEHGVFRHVQEIDRETLRELVLSRSYCAVLPEGERRPVLERVDALFDRHARDGVIRLPYLTDCFRAVKMQGA